MHVMKRRNGSLISGVWGGIFCLLVSGVPAWAQEPPLPAAASDQSVLYQEGMKLFDQQDYAGARVKLRAAYDRSKYPMALWYEAICARNLRDGVAYIRLIGEIQASDPAAFLGEGVTEADLAALPASLSVAMKFVGPLRLQVDQAGAEVFVDGRSIGKTPLSPPPVLLNMGEQKIRVVKAGFKDVERLVKVVGGAEVNVAVTLERIIHEGRLSIDAGTDGLIWIDGKMVGRGQWEGAVVSGGHTLKVSAPGKLPKEQEVIVVDDRRREIHVTLAAAPSQEWKKWVWMGVGGALLTGTVLGGALLARPSQPLRMGTIGPGVVYLPSGD